MNQAKITCTPQTISFQSSCQRPQKKHLLWQTDPHMKLNPFLCIVRDSTIIDTQALDQLRELANAIATQELRASGKFVWATF